MDVPEEFLRWNDKMGSKEGRETGKGIEGRNGSEGLHGRGLIWKGSVEKV